MRIRKHFVDYGLRGTSSFQIRMSVADPIVQHRPSSGFPQYPAYSPCLQLKQFETVPESKQSPNKLSAFMKRTSSYAWEQVTPIEFRWEMNEH